MVTDSGMLLNALLLGSFGLLQTAKPAPVKTGPPSLSFESGAFVVKRGDLTESIPLSAKKVVPKFVAFRKDKNFAVWDGRGLTIRAGEQVKSYKLPELAVSPKLFERDEIRSNLKLFASGERSKNANALSGAKRIGNDVYFLARWEDKEKKPWLEALVRVDLEATDLKWHLVGKFEGLSLASQSIDDQPLLHNGFLAVIIRKGEEWGESFYSRNLNGFGFKKLGKGLTDFEPTKEGTALFVEKTSYGTSIGGEVDIEKQIRREMLEVRGTFKMLDGGRPVLAIDPPMLRNAESGSEFTLPKDSGVKRCAAGVIVFTPEANPTSAVLYDPERWTPLARWKGKAAPAREETATPP